MYVEVISLVTESRRKTNTAIFFRFSPYAILNKIWFKEQHTIRKVIKEKLKLDRLLMFQLQALSFSTFNFKIR